MGCASEFKAFALKGHVMNLAVGVIIGGTFGKIDDSLVRRHPHAHRVQDLRRPRLQQALHPAGRSAGRPKKVAMTLADLGKAGVPMLAYGRFIAVAINVMFLAFAIFMMVRQIKRPKAGRAARAAGNAARA